MWEERELTWISCTTHISTRLPVLLRGRVDMDSIQR